MKEATEKAIHSVGPLKLYSRKAKLEEWRRDQLLVIRREGVGYKEVS